MSCSHNSRDVLMPQSPAEWRRVEDIRMRTDARTRRPVQREGPAHR